MLTRAKSVFKRLYQWNWTNYLSWGFLLLSMQTETAFGASGVTLDHFVRTASKNFALIKGLMIILAFMGGIVFMMMGITKFKAYRDNPAQIPLSTPFVLMAVASGLLFLPTVFELAGSALFGEMAQPGLPLSSTINF